MNKAPDKKQSQQDDGFALLSSVGIMLVLAVVAGGILALAWAISRSSTNHTHGAEDAYYIESALYLLQARIEQGLIDLNGEYPQAVEEEVFGHTFKIRLEEEDARLNINRAPKGLLKLFFQEIGKPEGQAERFAARIIDWRDVDNLAGRGGAEAADYRVAAHEGYPRNAPFASLEELQLVLGMENIFEDTPCLHSNLTVYSERAIPVNMKTNSVIEKIVNAYQEAPPANEGSATVKTLRLFVTPKDAENKTTEIVMRYRGRRQAYTASLLYWNDVRPDWQTCQG